MAEETTRETELLGTIVKALVDHPEDVKIVRSVDEMGVLISLDVHPEDMGKVIGRKGNTAKAIRSLLRVVGMRNNARVNLKINEPAGGKMADLEGKEREPQTQTMRSLDDVVEDLKL